MTLPETRRLLVRGALLFLVLGFVTYQFVAKPQLENRGEYIPAVSLTSEERRRLDYERRERKNAERALFCAGRPSDVHC